MKQKDGSWICPTCTFHHPKSHNHCACCHKKAVSQSSSSQSSVAPAPAVPGKPANKHKWNKTSFKDVLNGNVAGSASAPSQSSSLSLPDASAFGKGKGKGEAHGKRWGNKGPYASPQQPSLNNVDIDALCEAVISASGSSCSANASAIKQTLRKSLGIAPVAPVEAPKTLFSLLHSLTAQKKMLSMKCEAADVSIKKEEDALQHARDYRRQLGDKFDFIDRQLDDFPSSIQPARISQVEARLDWFERYASRLCELSQQCSSENDLRLLLDEIATVKESHASAPSHDTVDANVVMTDTHDASECQPVGHFQGGANLPWVKRPRGRSPGQEVAGEGRTGECSRSPRRVGRSASTPPTGGAPAASAPR